MTDMLFIRDTGSSSGTFVNRKQLSSPHRESEPEEIKSGDVVQFGLDWVFTTEKTPYRTVRARVTCVFPRPGAQVSFNRSRLPVKPVVRPQFRRPAFSPSREELQHRWNKVARKAGAARLAFVTFVNEIDLEEIPPSIGSSFVYLERSYCFVRQSAQIARLSVLEKPPFRYLRRENVDGGRRDDVEDLPPAAMEYCFDLDAMEIPRKKKPRSSYSIDASEYGNWTRFKLLNPLSHSCSPNLKLRVAMWDSMPEVIQS
ncbi:hypothetical protein B0H16DRAFT_1472777 [Mycena metata]|uniref:FHA domain-containing protein n=1 Tax=Mycena metata TaxID=1033252 RepID=A0AAD7HN64_9AGAR|nr:hypothetical protein B0H16DRAFT_1472777 [Mycena metata]